MVVDFFLKEIPQWFYLLSNSIQALGAIVCLFISYLGYKGYKITEEKKYQYFFFGFLFLGLGFLANLALNLLLRSGYAFYLFEKKYAAIITPLFGTYYFFLIGALLAYVSLAIAYSGIKNPRKIWLFYFWTLIIAVFAFRQQSAIFNMFAAIIISFIVIFTYDKYKESKNNSTLMIFVAFFCLFLFHLLALLQEAMKIFMLIRQLILLIGLIILLITLLKIHYGRKKK